MSEIHSAYEALQWDLPDRLRKAMRYAGKSPGEIATDLGVHRNTVTNYLTGRTAVDRRTLISWAFATGVPVQYLENGSLPQDGGPGGGGGGDVGTAGSESLTGPYVAPLALVTRAA